MSSGGNPALTTRPPSSGKSTTTRTFSIKGDLMHGCPEQVVERRDPGELAAEKIEFLGDLEFISQRVTTALRWPSSSGIPTGRVTVPRPAVTTNLAFTFPGLLALGVPTRALRGA